MEYIGEHLLPGQVGHFFVVLSFVAALLSAVSYFFATQKDLANDQNTSNSWNRLGRMAFTLHAISIFVVSACLFYILLNKYYEYSYAQANISDDQLFKYTFAAFWKDQQGSFMLWSMWQVVLGLILIFRRGKWENPVLSVIASAETVIATMILGIYFGTYRVGAGVFDLLRDVVDAPIFKQADYLTKIEGAGLNPLLQNYWMTIHPPTLFLGFASTVVPFAFAIAGLWTRRHNEWLKPAMPWALFSGAILGLGILMGAVWAYEALSFGGYWAWDPVENASLVPWIILVAGIHTHLIANTTGRSIRATYVFYLCSFIFVLYSTYLTRSGILGDTSAHAFTELGLTFQLVMFILLFVAFGKYLLLTRWRGIPSMEQEEGLHTREFWMFIGSLVLFFSATLMTGATSLPVFNKIIQYFNHDYVGAAIKDPIEHHNRYQLWIAVFIGFLTGIAQLLRYQERNWAIWMPKFFKHIAISLGISAVLTYLNTFELNVNAWQYFTLLFAACFGLVANLDYLLVFLKGNLKAGASALSHIGFAVLVLGILYTGLNKEWISQNAFAMEGIIEGLGENGIQKNVLLMRDAPMPIKYPWKVVYQTDTLERQTRTFQVKFEKIDSLGNPQGEEFDVQPNVMYDRGFTRVVASNPSTKHYWNKDIFTLVSSLPKAELDPEYAKQQEDSIVYQLHTLAIGDTAFMKEHYVIFDGVNRSPSHPEYHAKPDDLAFGLEYRVGKRTPDGSGEKKASAVMYVRPGSGAFALSADIKPFHLRIKPSETALEEIFKRDAQLKYQKYRVKDGGSFTHNGFKVTMKTINKAAEKNGYIAQQGDLAVAAQLEILSPKGNVFNLEPFYVVRDARPFSMKDESFAEGVHIRFTTIDPENEMLEFDIATEATGDNRLPVNIADEMPSSDYIVMEAIVFPGINLVWFGSLLMLFGLAMSMWIRRKSLRVTH
jgi:cytochrome c-type biogenesis protein CcmF